MVISIDAGRYWGKLEATDGRRAAVAEGIREPNDEVLAPARGAMCGLLLSCALWVGLLAAGRAVLTLIR
jgi:hypothetical protein